MIILDTNVVSALMRPKDNRVVVDWLDRQASVSIWTTAMTVFEISFGLMMLPNGRRRKALEHAFADFVREDLEGRILAFDAAAAAAAAAPLAVAYRRSGRQVEVHDIQIAGVAIARKAAVATRNTKHFDDLSMSVVDPWSQ
jgi:predicted nucleic acid-binding protein